MSFLDQSEAAVALCYTALGDAATYTPQTGQPVSLQVVHDQRGADMLDGMGVRSVEHAFYLRKTDVAQPVRGDTITDSTGTYTVDGFQVFNEFEWLIDARA